MKQFWFQEVWNIIFPILKNQYLTNVELNFKEALGQKVQHPREVKYLDKYWYFNMIFLNI